MADNTEQPLDNPEPSTQQQISELRGEVHTLSNAMTTFFARFPVDPPHSDHHDPPPHHNPQPPRNPSSISSPTNSPSIPRSVYLFSFPPLSRASPFG
ncbi:hypothetical protein KEM48_003328 [Puccinia striiformis f. sp. tritici PST-130]|nr:hypothetical protein KEM48_003328 [Puccinia striiformis f. sp. tritici PST-130]